MLLKLDFEANILMAMKCGLESVPISLYRFDYIDLVGTRDSINYKIVSILSPQSSSPLIRTPTMCLLCINVITRMEVYSAKR